jgi:hypothetical protein
MTAKCQMVEIPEKCAGGFGGSEDVADVVGLGPPRSSWACNEESKP